MEKSGSELEQHYVTLLRELGKESGMLGQIFVKAQNKIQDPAKLYMLTQLQAPVDFFLLPMIFCWRITTSTKIKKST